MKFLQKLANFCLLDGVGAHAPHAPPCIKREALTPGGALCDGGNSAITHGAFRA